MLGLYNTLLVPLRLAAALLAAWRGRDAAGALEWNERLARQLPNGRPGALWIHGASLGEVGVGRTVGSAIHGARPDWPMAFSALSPAGRASLPGPPLADRSFYAPLDFRGLPGEVLDRLRPIALVLVETELWPNLLNEAAERDVPVLLVNGRLSPRRMTRYRRFSRLYRPALERLARVGVQSEGDAGRFVEVGLPRHAVEITGNVKYDIAVPDTDRDSVSERFGLARGRPVLVAGSTGQGEDGPVLDAFQQLRGEHPDLFLVLAPRHVERVPEVEREVARRRLAFHRLSRGDDSRAGGSDGLLVDTVGELASLYVLADVAFVGGTLVPVGGHNLLEPAAVGAPVLFGPHTEHFAEPASALEAAGGGIRVRDAVELVGAVRKLLADDAYRSQVRKRAGAVVTANRGALSRTLDLILETIEYRPDSGRAAGSSR